MYKIKILERIKSFFIKEKIIIQERIIEKPVYLKVRKAYKTEEIDPMLRKMIFKKITERFPCEDCLKKGIINFEFLTVHHSDKDPSNNVFENMKHVCVRCHSEYHEGMMPTNYRGQKGLTIGDVMKHKGVK